jgi:flavin reductase (DIM6/NTAB) family NADH-FMN oxidoreductase RutF
MSFAEMDVKAMRLNPFAMLNDEWALVSAGTAENYNTMTVSWGMMGTMWNKSTVMVFIRPQRYTKEFVDGSDVFTLSFYPKEYKKALGLLGSKSGRNEDKIRESGLTPYFTDNTVAFAEAHTLLVCRKLFGGQPLDETKFVDPTLESAFYPDKDFHYMYFGEVLKVLVKG